MTVKIGDTVKITDAKTLYYGKSGKVTKQGESGGCYVQFNKDENSVYFPWGYQRIKRG